jgi:hypothetical protein
MTDVDPDMGQACLVGILEKDQIARLEFMGIDRSTGLPLVAWPVRLRARPPPVI